MPGEPAETLIGVTGVGLGALLLYSAVKNKNPIAIIRNAVTTGNLDINSAGPLVSRVGWSDIASTAVRTAIILSLDKVQDSALRTDAKAYMQTGTGDGASIVDRLRQAGYSDIADSIQAYANSHGASIPSTNSGGGGGAGGGTARPTSTGTNDGVIQV